MCRGRVAATLVLRAALAVLTVGCEHRQAPDARAGPQCQVLLDRDTRSGKNVGHGTPKMDGGVPFDHSAWRCSVRKRLWTAIQSRLRLRKQRAATYGVHLCALGNFGTEE